MLLTFKPALDLAATRRSALRSALVLPTRCLLLLFNRFAISTPLALDWLAAPALPSPAAARPS